MSIDYNQKSTSIIYSCFVDLSKSGSYTEHIYGITEAAKNHETGLELWSTIKRDAKLPNIEKLTEKTMIFSFSKFKQVNYILFDIVGSFYLIRRAKSKPILYIRPNLSTILQFIVARILGLEIVIEINGISSEELKVKGKWYYVLARFIERIHLGMADRGICVSEGIRDFYSRITKTKLNVVSNGCRSSEVMLEPRVLPIKSHMECVFIGSLVPWQGLLEFLKALKGYENLSRLKINVFGEGELESDIKLLSQELGLELIFHGWVESNEIPQKLRGMHVALLPRLSQGPSGSPLKLFRYMSMGFPIITTNADGIKELEKLDTILLKFDYSNVKTLHTLLDNILFDKIDLKTTSRRTLDITRESFTWDISFQKIFANN